MKASFHPGYLALLTLVAGMPLTAADEAFFESRIRPVLVQHCYDCHSQKAGKAKGGLLLDTKTALLQGGDSGPAVVPGKPGESLLLTAIEHSDPDLQMPPKKPQLAKSVRDDFRRWIADGAVDPRVGDAAAAKPLDVSLWSLQPITKTFRHASVDAFIQEKLKTEGLSSNPPADPVTLRRRLQFALTGLPPSPEDITAMEQEAYPATVDRLLASQEFGVRWGRHWLDVARFAESNGRESNLAFPHAWRYRDYVIDAFNDGIPFDRFITEQLAGDLLPAGTPEERARLLVATGFLALGAKGLNEMNPGQFAADLADEQLDTTTRAFLASSIACARCHDHKSDPWRMEDYYALAGIFRSTETFYGNWIDSENNNASRLIRLPDLPGQLIPGKSLTKEKVEQLKQQLASLDEEEKAMQTELKKARDEGRDLGEDGFKFLQNTIRIYWSRGGIDGRLMTMDASGAALPLCMGVSDRKTITDAELLHRGELAHPVKAIPRRFPEALTLESGPLPATQSGRLELARWITHPDHPLTARVLANRVWRHLFGAGLVRTADDFGRTGEPPSHPELLDFLARRLLENQWSVKSLIREIVLSETWQQASTYRADAYQADPDNRLHWRASKRRLEAEVIRDSMLSVSGLLDTTRRPGTLVSEFSGQSISLISFNSALPADLDGSRHRSVYLPILRDHLPDFLEQFDFATPSLVIGDRDVTNVPMQALFLMNSAFVWEQAKALASRLQNEESEPASQVLRAFSLCFNRPPDELELRQALAFLSQPGQNSVSPETVLAAFCQSLLASAEFRHAD